MSITSGQNALTVTGASFTAADVGKDIVVPGAGAAAAQLVTTIASYVSTDQVTLTANAGTTLAAASATVIYGSDDTTAIQALITAGGGGWVPNGWYMISTTLLFSVGNVALQGAGYGDLHDTGTQIVAPCRFTWMGALGGTMAKVLPPGAQYLAGNVFDGIFLDGNNGLAAIGLNVWSVRQATCRVMGAHCTTALFQTDIATFLSEPAGCSENTFRVAGYQTNAGDGSLVICNSTPAYNTTQNTWEFIGGDFYNQQGAIKILGSDSETFEVIKLYTSDASGVGLILGAGATPIQAARNNMFRYFGCTGATVQIFAEGTSYGAYPSNENNIDFLDTANNPNPPSLDTGATLWWGATTAPIGMQDYSESGHSFVEVGASGIITQGGLSGTIAGGATGTITLAATLGTTVLNVTLEATAAVTLPPVANASTTQLIITNQGSVAAAFWWQVKGK